MTRKERLIEIIKSNYHNREIIESYSFTNDLLMERLELIPKKLYKYREYNDYNIDSLENDYIWFSPPSECDDDFDCTVHYDLAKQFSQIKEFVFSHIDDFILLFITIALKNRNIKNKFTKEQIKSIREACFSSEGVIIKEKAKEYLVLHGEDESLKLVETVMSKIKGCLNDNTEDFEHVALMLMDVINGINDHTRKKTMIYCLCETYKNEALWSKYAKENTGYCIEYSFESIKHKDKSDIKNLFYLMPVYYGKKKEYKIVSFFEDGMNKHLFKNDIDNGYSEDDIIELNVQLQTKNYSWSWQKEWRIALKFENNNRQPFPFISKIILGCNAKDELKEKLINICKLKKIPLYIQYKSSSNSEYKYRKLKQD